MSLDEFNGASHGPGGPGCQQQGQPVCAPLAEKTHLPKAMDPIKKNLQSSRVQGKYQAHWGPFFFFLFSLKFKKSHRLIAQVKQ